MKHILNRRRVGQDNLFDGFRKKMGDVFQEFFGELETSPFSKSDFLPKIDVEEQGNKFVVWAEIPGVSKEQIEVEIKNKVLTIKGEKKQESRPNPEAQIFLKERAFGVFERSFTFSVPIDSEKTKASFVDGVLTIEIPKKEEKTAQNRILVE